MMDDREIVAHAVVPVTIGNAFVFLTDGGMAWFRHELNGADFAGSDLKIIAETIDRLRKENNAI